MGLSFQRSVRFGPLRFNFSTSGIGISAGIPGLRIGTGPRGAYINAGTHGFRYRASLNPSHAGGPSSTGPAASFEPHGPDDVIGHTVYETGDVLKLTDASAADLLSVLNRQAGHIMRWPLALATGLLVIGYTAHKIDPTSAWQRPIVPLEAITLILGVTWLAWRDHLRKLTVLFYDLDDTTARAFESFSNAWRSVSAVSDLWNIPQSERYADKKYHGGATVGLQRKRTQVRLGSPPNVRCNLPVPLLDAEATTMAFYPDRLLVFRAKHVGAVAYSALRAQPSEARFNEESHVPSDAQVVGRTWRYVNKGGGPDRRFKTNPEIPVCAYSELLLSSEQGLSAFFMASKRSSLEIVPKAIKLLSVLEQHSREEVSHRAAG
jgi:hypothetical protein